MRQIAAQDAQLILCLLLLLPDEGFQDRVHHDLGGPEQKVVARELGVRSVGLVGGDLAGEAETHVVAVGELRALAAEEFERELADLVFGHFERGLVGVVE